MQQELKLERIVTDSIRWDPKPDISANELALALNILLPHRYPGSAARILANSPDTVKRHFIYRLEP